MARYRLDVLLFQRGLAPTREKARALVLAAKVRVNGKIIDKAGTAVAEDAEIILEPNRNKYVSRGGQKLEKALQEFNLEIKNKVVLDIGASTGGFTDCILQHGAARVYAVDVGYGQLDWTLRHDPRVINMEKRNIRNVTLADIGEKVDLVLIDVSFISVQKILPGIKGLMKDQGEMIVLVKPQFEAGREKVGKRGVVKDPAVHREVLSYIIQAGEKVDLHCAAVGFSPIKGPQGNIEFLVHLLHGIPGPENIRVLIEKTVADAHALLGVR